jgi:hypothetical protein
MPFLPAASVQMNTSSLVGRIMLMPDHCGKKGKPPAEVFFHLRCNLPRVVRGCRVAAECIIETTEEGASKRDHLGGKGQESNQRLELQECNRATAEIRADKKESLGVLF